MEKIAIYGGAFNPPTLGHQEVMVKMLTKGYVDKIIFSPDGQREDKNYLISPEKRRAVIETFASEMCQKGFNIEFEDYFLHNNSPTTTMEVENYYRQKLGFQPYHIFGIDTISSMPKWTGNTDKYLEKKLKKIFLLRKGFLLPDEIDMENYEILDLDILEISSTLVREMLKNKLQVRHILSPGVYDYIMKNELYQN
ncbi:MAG: nicotinate-nicotinamide nucleotide adenylyltransferase [Candidatus Altimarinota bacterium]